MIYLGPIEHSSTSVIVNLPIFRSDTGQGMTGLTNSSTGLSIAHSYDNNAGAVDTSAATSSIETIATLFTYATPTSGFVRFRELDATGRPGMYQLMFEDSVFSQTDSATLYIDINGVTNMMDMQYYITLDGITLTDINSELSSYGVPTVTQMNARTRVSAEYAQSADTDALADTLADMLDGTSPVHADLRRVVGEVLQQGGSGGQKYGGA